MTGIIIAIIVIVVLVAIALALWSYMRKRSVERAQQQFGPEYERAVQEYGSSNKAADVLQERKEQVEKIDIHPLSAEQRQQYMNDWQAIQAQFVDDPGSAVGRADDLIQSVMRTIGYPTSQFGQREEAVSVQYPQVADNYRKAHDIAEQQANGQASTEDLREATLLYRSLFDRLVGAPVGNETGTSS